MRRLVGILLMLTAVGCSLAGSAMAIVLGPDSRAVTGPHPMSFDGVALVTAPQVISWAGPTVTVAVELPGQTPVFVGLGNAVDVADYLRTTRLKRVDSFQVPWTVTTSEVGGRDFVPAAPTALDWWLAQSAGQGGAAITFPLPDQTVSLAVIAIGDATLEGLEVTASYDVKGGFGIGLGLAGFGIGLALFGWIAFRRGANPRGWDDDEWDDEPGRGREDEPATAEAAPAARRGHP